ncbi:26S proteasome non-ATPase regulatory subunit 8 [Galemys pyrenaicus]|uniref:26S proteasome non-ATPase regulatory subunit 8 n=1 Tax=Galemys pyrenaicus TaxID=202257 RepID=A0A8J6DVY8_GALPY|nr:26S proteasome non-ATPase regulatory subunit 8 [Galemys pyrenaicus]
MGGSVWPVTSRRSQLSDASYTRTSFPPAALAHLKCCYFDYKEQPPSQLTCTSSWAPISPCCCARTDDYVLPRLSRPMYPSSSQCPSSNTDRGQPQRGVLAKCNIPIESCAFCIDILPDTARDEIARYTGKACGKILTTEAAQILHFNIAEKMPVSEGRASASTATTALPASSKSQKTMSTLHETGEAGRRVSLAAEPSDTG